MNRLQKSGAQTFKLSGLAQCFAALFLAASMTFLIATDAESQRRNRDREEQEDDGIDRTFTSAIGEIVLEAQEQLDTELYAEAINTLGRALERGPNPYESSIIWQLRGRAYYETDRIDLAIQDWQRAIGSGGMNQEEQAGLRINIGQLYIAEERYAEGIRAFEDALAAGVDLTPRLARMLAQAYGTAERMDEGLQYAESFWERTPSADRTRSDYSLMLFYYQSLDMLPEQLAIVEDLVQRWPAEEANWGTYANLLVQLGREPEAFEVNKIMYINGMLDQSREIVRVAQYYSYYEYPYRGAEILEQGLNAGLVENTEQNLNLLANLWRQAREWERAIPVLEQLARLTNDGDNYAKLGEALYALERQDEAEAAFVQALDRRQDLDNTGTIWNLLGTVRLELNNESGALAAFQEGARFTGSDRRTANAYITFIRNTQRARTQRVELQEKIRRDECSFTVGDLRETAVLLGTVDETGQVVVDIPERCADLYNQYGDPIGEALSAG